MKEIRVYLNLQENAKVERMRANLGLKSKEKTIRKIIKLIKENPT